MMKALLVLGFSLLAGSCGMFDDEDDGHGGGAIVQNDSKLSSNSLAALTSASCSSDSSTCTPRNLSGRVFAAGALLGNDSDGSNNYNMTFLAADPAIIEDPSDTSHPQGILKFSLDAPGVFSGLISIPEEDSMPDNPVITRLETYFDYIDARFGIEGTTGLNAEYTVRLVFRKTATADDVVGGGTMQIGDKLIMQPGQTKFHWCNSEHCFHETRPSDALQDSNIINIDNNNDSQPGNPDYALYSIDLKESITVGHSEISDSTRLWTVNFDVSGAINFSKNPSSMEDVDDMVASFTLGNGCNFEGCTTSDNRIRATLSIGEPGSAN